MYLPAMKSPTKAQIEASARNRAERKARIDIQKIDNALKDSDPLEMEELHRYLDGKYQYCIANWGNSMYGYIAGPGFKYDFLGHGSSITQKALTQDCNRLLYKSMNGDVEV